MQASSSRQGAIPLLHSDAPHSADPLTAGQVQGEAQRTFGPLLDRQAKADRIRLVSRPPAGGGSAAGHAAGT